MSRDVARGIKLAILGGGGFRTPYIYHELLSEAGDPFVDEVVLYDVSEDRLRAITAVMDGLGADHPRRPRVISTTDPRKAIEGSDFVFAAIRVGGLENRRCDEHVARELGVLGQETTGPGGVAFAIRTIPVMLEYARMVAELAPDAYFINFTNPAGIITEALQPILGDRVVGICDTPSSLVRRVAEELGLDRDRVRPEYVGLNHLGWLRGLRYDGRDVLPGLIEDDGKLAGLEEGKVFGAEFLRALQAIPNEYLYYYYNNREAVRAIVDAPFTRGDYLADAQARLFSQIGSDPASATQLWRNAVEERNSTYMSEARGGEPRDLTGDDAAEDIFVEGYAGVAVAVMRAIQRDQRVTMILNVRNGSTITGLPSDAVVEVTALVDANGVRPLNTSQPTLHQLGLMQQVKSIERHAIQAATTGDPTSALSAFALHPLVDSVSIARQLLSTYMEQIPTLAAILR